MSISKKLYLPSDPGQARRRVKTPNKSGKRGERINLLNKGLLRSGNYEQLNKEIGAYGLTTKSVQPLREWLELSDADLAKIISVSPRTVSRWKPSTRIGVYPSKTLIKIDEIISKGREVFGDDKSFRKWLREENLIFDHQTPLSILSKPFGAEMVSSVLDGLAYGNLV
jgi:putative toxin-antitoxin system antitoxin component (TIGR02293 family)